MHQKSVRTEDDFALRIWARSRFRDKVLKGFPAAVLLEIALHVDVDHELLRKGPRERLDGSWRGLRQGRAEHDRRF